VDNSYLYLIANITLYGVAALIAKADLACQDQGEATAAGGPRIVRGATDRHFLDLYFLSLSLLCSQKESSGPRLLPGLVGRDSLPVSQLHRSLILSIAGDTCHSRQHKRTGFPSFLILIFEDTPSLPYSSSKGNIRTVTIRLLSLIFRDILERG
jgi:hypothetical protein